MIQPFLSRTGISPHKCNEPKGIESSLWKAGIRHKPWKQKEMWIHQDNPGYTIGIHCEWPMICLNLRYFKSQILSYIFELWLLNEPLRQNLEVGLQFVALPSWGAFLPRHVAPRVVSDHSECSTVDTEQQHLAVQRPGHGEDVLWCFMVWNGWAVLNRRTKYENFRHSREILMVGHLEQKRPEAKKKAIESRKPWSTSTFVNAFSSLLDAAMSCHRPHSYVTPARRSGHVPGWVVWLFGKRLGNVHKPCGGILFTSITTFRSCHDRFQRSKYCGIGTGQNISGSVCNMPVQGKRSFRTLSECGSSQLRAP